jgi:tRNA pseudouridine55 synthase
VSPEAGPRTGRTAGRSSARGPRRGRDARAERDERDTREADGPEGVLVVDKPAGMTSHDVVDRVRRLAGTRRVGHTGTLDPAATGVLVLCLGRATRLVSVLQAGEKTYAAVARLGVTTRSDDLDGEVLATMPAGHVTERQVCAELGRFQGDIEQLPPVVSALRIDGERAHVRARRGEEVVRTPRRVRVESIMLDRFEPGDQPEVAFLIACSAGTYVRSVARDLGEALGVGGTLASLRRVANGVFTVAEAVTLDALEAQPDLLAQRMLTPLEALRRTVGVVAVTELAVARALAAGARPERVGIAEGDGTLALVFADRLLGVYGKGQDGPLRLVWSRPEDLPAEGSR